MEYCPMYCPIYVLIGICPIFKKGNKAECANYRGIMLLSVPYKILSIILLKRLWKKEKNTLKKCWTSISVISATEKATDQIFIVRQIMKKCLEFNTDVQCWDYLDKII